MSCHVYTRFSQNENNKNVALWRKNVRSKNSDGIQWSLVRILSGTINEWPICCYATQSMYAGHTAQLYPETLRLNTFYKYVVNICNDAAIPTMWSCYKPHQKDKFL